LTSAQVARYAIARMLFAVAATTLVLLQGFINKTQRTSRGDLKIQEKRCKEWLRGEAYSA